MTSCCNYTDANTSLKFGYSYEESHEYNKYLKSLQYKNDSKLGLFNLSNDYNYKNTERGNSLVLDFNCDYDITDQYDIWAGITYMDDEILGINDRLDWKIGTGFYLIKDQYRKTKASYGLIYRNNEYLHSLWLRDTFESWLLGYRAKIECILPSNNSPSELRLLFSPYISLLKKAMPGMTIQYVKRNGNRFFGMNFDINLRI